MAVSRKRDPSAKAALVKAAEEVFGERGLAGADIEEIARRAGQSPSAFYVHFENKEAIFAHVVESWMARCAAYFACPTEYPDGFDDADSLLDFVIERDVQLHRFFWDTRRTIRAISSASSSGELMTAFRVEMVRRNRAWLEQSQREGFVRDDIDLDAASALMSGGFEALTYALIRYDERPPLEDWIALGQETFVRGFGTPELVAVLERRRRRASTSIDALRPEPAIAQTGARRSRQR